MIRGFVFKFRYVSSDLGLSLSVEIPNFEVGFQTSRNGVEVWKLSLRSDCSSSDLKAFQ